MKKLTLAILIAVTGMLTLIGTASAAVWLDRPGLYDEGGPDVTVNWTGPLGTTVEVMVVAPGGYGYQVSGSGNPSTGSLNWSPVTLYTSPEWYKIQVNWYAGGVLVACEETEGFVVRLKGAPRMVKLRYPYNETVLQANNLTPVNWKTSKNITRGESMDIRLYLEGSEAAGTIIGGGINDGREICFVPANLPSGWYSLVLTFVNRYGIMCQSDSARVYVQGQTAPKVARNISSRVYTP